MLLSPAGAERESPAQHAQQEAEYRTDAAAGGHTTEAGRGADRAHVDDEGGDTGAAAVLGVVLPGVQLLCAGIG